MKKFLAEFKEFAMRGNVIDMAIGVVIGTAFGKIVSSLVNDIIMPILSILTGRITFSSLSIKVPPAVHGAEPISINYGVFLQSAFDFLVIAFSIFLAVKLINRLRREKKEETPPPPPEISREEILLTEIRDLLKEQNKTDC